MQSQTRHHLEPAPPSAVQWVHRDVYPGPSGFAVPVIVPEDAARGERWGEVLRWYEDEADDASYVLPERDHCGRASGWVIAVGAGAVPSASVLAERTGRPLLCVAAAVAVREELAARAIDEAVVVALAHDLGPQLVAQLNGVRSLDWRLLLSYDEAGLSFVIAKQIFARRRGPLRLERAIVLDAIARELYDVSGDGTCSPARELTPAEAHHVVDGRWDLLVLRAHGEGTHVNLDSIVLCGLVGTEEVDLGGRPVAGCAAQPGGWRCKRTHGVGVVARHLVNLRARTLALYSCNGLQTSGVGYPSNVSVVAALMDGYAVSVLCNDRPGALSPAALYAGAAQALADSTLRSLVREENDRNERLDGDRPWVLVGDGDAPSPAAEDTNSRLMRFDLPPSSSPSPLRVWGVEPAATVQTLLVGARSAVAVLRAAVSAADRAQIRLLDRTEDLEASHRRILRLRHGALVSTEVFYTLVRSLERNPDRDPSFKALVEALSACRVDLQVVCFEALAHVQAARRDGFDRRERRLTEELASLVASELQSRLADVAERGTVSGSVDRLFASPGSLIARREQEACQRCGLPTVVRHFEDPGGLLPDGLRADCPVCGPMGGWFVGGPRLVLSAPRECVPGRSIEVAVTTIPPFPADLPGEGILCVALKDKGNGRVSYTHRGRLAPGAEVMLTIPIAEDVTLDLHTLRVIWVVGLSLTYARTRIAAVQRPDARGGGDASVESLVRYPLDR